MLHAIRQTFFKIRVYIGAIRNGLLGLALVVAGWVFLAPHTQTELDLLGIQQGTTPEPTLLRAHRVAKVMAMIDSDRFYTFVADNAETGQTAEDIRDSVAFAADGFAGLAGGASQPAGVDETQKAFTRNIGAKFVPARTN